MLFSLCGLLNYPESCLIEVLSSFPFQSLRLWFGFLCHRLSLA